MLTGIPCLLMRGGTSKGPFFLDSDLPDDPVRLHRTLLAVMGSEHVRQIDGIGGGDSLTSKAVIVSPAGRIETRVDIDSSSGTPRIRSAGVVRTARLLLAGRVFVSVPAA